MTSLAVSINYPWGTALAQDGTGRASCGWDFGDRPSGYSDPFWKTFLERDLALFDRLDLHTVRMAILFNGLTWGIGPQAPQMRDGHWDFDPVPLSAQFRDDFRELVTRFAAFADGTGQPRIQLMPCLFGFELVSDSPLSYAPVDYSDFDDLRHVRYCAGRREAALGLLPMLDGAHFATRQEAFLTYVVDDLLSDFDPGGPLFSHRNVIHSIDLCGEPEEFIPAPNAHGSTAPIEQPIMLQLLNNGIARISAHGFPATIGFQFMTTADRPEWWPLTPHVGQFHYYDNSALPPVHGGRPALIGEVATSPQAPFDERVARLFGSGGVPLGARLEWFERLRYREVFLWAGGRGPDDNVRSFGPTTFLDVRRFAAGERPHRDVIDAAALAAGLGPSLS